MKRFLLHPVIARMEERIARSGASGLFVLGLIVYLFVHSAFVLVPIFRRAAPVEPDDAYSYIVRAAEVESCFRQDCPALNDLRAQLTLPVANDEAALERFRQYHRVISFYTPLYSVALAVLHTAGLTWESALQTLQVAGLFFVGLAVAVWLYVLWGPGPAGFALLFLAVSPYLHGTPPHVVGTGIALLTWALIVRKRGPSPWGILVGIVLMLSLHPSGRVFAAETVILYFCLADRSRPARRWLVSTLGLLFLATTFVLPLFLSGPELGIAQDPAPQGWSFLQGIRDQVIVATKAITQWIGFDTTYRLREMGGATGGLLLVDFVFLLVLGFATVCLERRKRILIVAALLLPMVIGSLVLMLPHYPAAVFGRVVTPLFVLLVGAIGQVAWACLTYALGWFRSALHGELGSPPSGDHALVKNGWRVVLLVLMAIVLCRYSFYSVHTKMARMSRTLSREISRADIVLDPSQCAVLLANAREGDRVLYADEPTLYFFLTYGAFDVGAVYLPAIRGTPDEKTWLDTNKNIRFVATMNPLAEIFPLTRKGLFLKPGEKVEVHSQSTRPLASVLVQLANPGSETILTARVLAPPGSGSEKTSIEIRVPREFTGWLPITRDAEIAAGRFALEVAAGKGPVYLNGIRVESDSKLNWPWDQGISLVYSGFDDEPGSVVASFSSKALCACLNRPLRILTATGSTVLAQVGD